MAIGEDDYGNYFDSPEGRHRLGARTNYASTLGTGDCFGKSEYHSPLNSPANRAGEGSCKNHCDLRSECEYSIRDKKKTEKTSHKYWRIE